MSKRDTRITKYIDGAEPFAKPILKRLRKLVHSAGKVEETIKWGMPTFLYNDRILCGVAGFNEHCAMWFWHGSAATKVKVKGGGMGQFGKIKSLEDLPPASVIQGILKTDMKKSDTLAKAKPAKRRTPKGVSRRKK